MRLVDQTGELADATLGTVVDVISVGRRGYSTGEIGLFKVRVDLYASSTTRLTRMVFSIPAWLERVPSWFTRVLSPF
jgi:hypothetical protein